MSIVVDASALLAILRGEPGADVVIAASRNALLSAVNLTEVLAKISDLSLNPAIVNQMIARLEFQVEPFDAHQAEVAAALRAATRHHQISLADRACLALATVRDLPVLTADRKWAELNLGIEVRLIR
jgi:ribonuclease VapC